MNEPTHNKSNGAMEIAEYAAKLASRLFDGETTKRELDEIRAYFADTEGAEIKDAALQRALAASLKSAYGQRAQGIDHAAHMWVHLARTTGLSTDLFLIARQLNRHVRPVHRPMWRTLVVRAAAVIIPAAVVVGGFFALDLRITSDGESGDIAAATEAPAVFTATHTIPAQADRLRHVTLPDGTEVTLNRNSTFAYNDNREAELSGEAWFEVAKDLEHPFVIHSDYMTVTVLGTVFNFDTGVGTNRSTLSLYEGRVKLTDAFGEHELGDAGREFTLDHATNLADIHDFDTSRMPQWITAEERSRIEILSLHEIFNLIESTYGVQIANRGAVDSSRRYTFDIDGAHSLGAAMHTLELANGEFSYTIDGTTVTLVKKER